MLPVTFWWPLELCSPCPKNLLHRPRPFCCYLSSTKRFSLFVEFGKSLGLLSKTKHIVNCFNYKCKCCSSKTFSNPIHLLYHLGSIKESVAWKGSEGRLRASGISSQYTTSILIFYYNARAKYFSELINSNQHKPSLLFKTTDWLVNPSSPPITSNTDCEIFLTFFIDKTDDIQCQGCVWLISAG